MDILILLTLLGIKHLIVDFFLQPPLMWQNKGTYGHFGGILHSGLHAIVTFFILFYFILNPLIVLTATFVEFLIHYHMDWFKMWWNKKKGYTPQTEEFWEWLGIDQFIHYMTYIGIAALLLI